MLQAFICDLAEPIYTQNQPGFFEAHCRTGGWASKHKDQDVEEHLD